MNKNFEDKRGIRANVGGQSFCFVLCTLQTKRKNYEIRGDDVTIVYVLLRPVVARRGTIKEPVKCSGLPGHLSIGRIKFQKLGEEMRKAVSTSHHSQSNTIEHEMAVEWRVLQEKSSLWWKALHEKQAAEIELLRGKLKSPIWN
ncbi:hypothetical protein A4A49_11244 [Nicotiana attenuata]|uniref:Uncharacterized protein n=1 Tax=Nicotiana attenuata TaxID=49451 RepID=A0A314KWU9_NICAT|nr:hypothetical protein A4A49_11244 [Nicotiana attenuata]